MTKLSININKIALLRNWRGRNFPDVQAFAARCLDLGAHGLTFHPRHDQKFARYSDIEPLSQLCKERGRELNVEGYPSAEFLSAVKQWQPEQCTLVAETPDPVSVNYGWNIGRHANMLKEVIGELKAMSIRTCLFVNYDYPDMAEAKQVGADRVQLHTQSYAAHYNTLKGKQIFEALRKAVERAHRAGLGVNAGHDLNLENLAALLKIPDIREVSIGPAVVIESIQFGIEQVISRYVRMVNAERRLNVC
ncbi:MAG: pyridoxine 5'-phosphate synthase [Sulfuriferula sp.]